MSGTLFGDEAVPASPNAEWITAHCDGGSRGNPGPAGYGVSVTADDGRVLAELSEFLGVCSNNVAEYRGLLASLDWAIAHHYSRLRVISDSLLMVNQIKGRYKVNSPDLRPLWEAARSKIRHFAQFDISHALRHKNKDADRLANEAMDKGTGRPAAGPPSRAAAPAVAASARLATPGASAPRAAAAPNAAPAAARNPAPAAASKPMLRGFVRDGSVHLLGGSVLPEGIFVKVIPE